MSKLKKVLSFLLSALVLYVGVSFVLFFLSIYFFKTGASDLLNGDLKKAELSFQKSKELYSVSSNTVSIITYVPLSFFSLTILSDDLTAYEGLMHIMPDMVQVLNSSNSSSFTKSQLGGAFAAAIELYFLFQRYDLRGNFKKVLPAQTVDSASKYLPFSQVAQSVLGYDREKSYLILFQNNNELRPTGGFIGSVGNVSIKNGKVVAFDIHDVYELDGQLKGHVDPPFIVGRYLQPHLYLRDSNFAPSFEEAASQSAYMYNLESGKKIDGVIAIDTQVLKKVLEVSGPVTLPGESNSLTSQNAVETLQNSIQENFFPGSTEKKQLLGSLLGHLMLEFKSNKKMQLKLIKNLPNLIAQKHILFAFDNDSIQKQFTAAGFSASLTDIRIKQNELRDFLSINEANIGVNKENEFLDRKITYSAFIKPGMLSSDVLIDYSNKGQGGYDAYLRVIVPINANLLSISINGEDQKIIPAVTDQKIYGNPRFIPPVGFEVDQKTKDDKKLIGFVIHIPKASTQRVRVLYQNEKIVPQNSFTYSLLYIKQPGTLDYPLTVQLQTNNSYQLSKINGEASPIVYDGQLLTDKEFDRFVTRVQQ